MDDLVNRVALSAWLATVDGDPSAVGEMTLLAGGSQNVLLQFERGGRPLVLRKAAASAHTDGNRTMMREARVLAALAHTAVPHPRLIAQCDKPEVLGGAFYVMEAVDGFTPTLGMPAFHAGSVAVRHRMGLAMVEGCAALGAVDYLEKGLGDFGNPADYLSRQIGRWSRQLASYADYGGWPGSGSLPDLEPIASWLERHKPADFTPGLIHGDYHIANVMFRNDSAELAAILDWELSTLGDPLIDLGWMLLTWQDDGPLMDGLVVEPWQGFPRRAELVDHYGRHSERDLSAVDWYLVLAAYKFAILLEGTHARACAGLADMATGRRLHLGAISALERAAPLIR